MLDHLVGPGIELQEAGERHGGLLLEVVVVELGRLGDHGLQPEGAIRLQQAVADHAAR